MATKEQMKEEFAYFREAWNFFKKFYEVQERETYWDSVIAEAGEIMRHHDSPLCKDVILAIIDELERKYSVMRKMKQNAT